MISQREVKRRYEKLMKKVETDDYYKIDLESRFNCYICSCGRMYKSKDVDAGCTPMMIPCNCGSYARSSFYKDVLPTEKHKIEWYRPSLEEVMKQRKNEHFLDHVFNGGLEMRFI